MITNLARTFDFKSRKVERRKNRDEYLLSVAQGYATMSDWIDQEEDEKYIEGTRKIMKDNNQQ